MIDDLLRSGRGIHSDCGPGHVHKILIVSKFD